MKYLCSFILAVLLAATSFAAQSEYSLNITKDGTIIHDQKDWHFVTKSDGHDIYIEKGMLGSKAEIVKFHAYIPYHKPLEIYEANVVANVLYVYGSLHCGKQKLMLLEDLYVDVNNKIVFNNSYGVNSHIVDLNIPGTTRFDILNLVCKESI